MNPSLNSLNKSNSIETLQESLKCGKPEIFNTDQGSQFTIPEFTSMLKSRDILIRMDGRGKALDNIFIERLWKTVKYELIYLSNFSDSHKLYDGLTTYFNFYNTLSVHKCLNYRTQTDLYKSQTKRKINKDNFE